MNLSMIRGLLSRHIINLLAEGDLRKFSDIGAWYAIEDCAQYDKKCSNPTSAISNETIANPNAQIVRDDMVRVHVPRCMAWLDYDEHVDSLSTIDKKVGVTIPESTTQTLPSFVEYTPPVTYSKEVEKTLGTPIKVEPLNETKLEEVGLNCNHNVPFSSREVPSFDGPEPQPLLISPSLDMFDYDWGLESKEVSPLGEELSLFDRPNEVERGTDIPKITRKQSKASKHGHENQKSSKRSQRIKAEARKVKPQSNHGQQKSTRPKTFHFNPQLSQKSKNVPSSLIGPEKPKWALSGSLGPKP
ncbi:hypothetical protein Tco_0216765 [Tanacetum coccineum]